MNEIEQISMWDLQKTQVHDLGNYCMKDLPSATPENMFILLNKINELTETINELIKKTTLSCQF
jgi:spore coat protein CotF